MISAILLLAMALPDPKLTPGAIFPTATAALVCKTGYAEKMRQVTTSRKIRICARYHALDCPGPKWEVDHLIPLSLGGSNDDANLWPQPIAQARRKDVMEASLHRAVCAGGATLQNSQRMIIAPESWGIQ